jgi:hypothetical protein
MRDFKPIRDFDKPTCDAKQKRLAPSVINPSGFGQSQQMGGVLEENPQMRHGIPARQLFVHVRLKGKPLHVFVFANFDKFLSTFIILVPKILHHAQNPKHFAVLFHEALAAFFEALGIACFQSHVRSIYAKMEVHSKTEAVYEARQLGWLR